MCCKKVLEPAQDRVLRKELEYLYHRRSAIQMLIRTLERLDRSRASRRAMCERRSA